MTFVEIINTFLVVSVRAWASLFFMCFSHTQALLLHFCGEEPLRQCYWLPRIQQRQRNYQKNPMRLLCLQNSWKMSYDLIHFYDTMATGADHTPSNTYNTETEYFHLTCSPSWGFLLLQKGLLIDPVKTGQSVLEKIMPVSHISWGRKYTWNKICQNPMLCQGIFKDVFSVIRKF